MTLTQKKRGKSPSGLYIVANVLDCNIVVSEFELQSRRYVVFWTSTFGKCMNSLILQATYSIMQQLFFCKNSFGIK